jgi:uncharacterized protein (DUF1697 family)
MARYIALLRAVNVGGTGQAPDGRHASDVLRRGLHRVETYIASGNVAFESKGAASKVKAELEAGVVASDKTTARCPRE